MNPAQSGKEILDSLQEVDESKVPIFEIVLNSSYIRI